MSFVGNLVPALGLSLAGAHSQAQGPFCRRIRQDFPLTFGVAALAVVLSVLIQLAF